MNKPPLPDLSPARHDAGQALVVIGMHRSGTSATTGALRCLGVQLGPRLYRGHADINAKGYFEHSDIADANDEALLAIDSSWDDVLAIEASSWERPDLLPFERRIRRCIRRDFARAPLWAIKDPRVCRMLPWWLRMLAAENVRPFFLFVIRPPYDVHLSLHRRDGFSLDKSMLLWAAHYLDAERDSRGYPRAFLNFEQLLEAPVESLARVEHALDVRFPTPVAQAADCLREFVSKDMRHHRDTPDMPESSEWFDLATQVHAALADNPDPTRMDALRARLEAIRTGFTPLLAEHLRGVAHARGQTQLAMRRLRRSWSWPLGKPLRLIERWMGKQV